LDDVQGVVGVMTGTGDEAKSFGLRVTGFRGSGEPSREGAPGGLDRASGFPSPL
jgi:hypothetical protein